jgi:hypothetical protein
LNEVAEDFLGCARRSDRADNFGAAHRCQVRVSDAGCDTDSFRRSSVAFLCIGEEDSTEVAARWLLAV